MNGWGWLVSSFYALVVVIMVILVVTLIAALIAWAAEGCSSGKKKRGCCSTRGAPVCPVYIRNPKPDDTTFSLGRADGSSDASNGCATGFFTVQRSGPSSLLYTVTTPENTLITDIYTLEVPCEGDFPLTTDGCAVDLSAFHHQTFSCNDTSNQQTFTSPLAASALCNRRGKLLISMLVVFSDDQETCETVQMMTVVGRAAKPIALKENCLIPPCPPEQCCDPVVPNFVRVKLPRCRALE